MAATFWKVVQVYFWTAWCCVVLSQITVCSAEIKHSNYQRLPSRKSTVVLDTIEDVGSVVFCCMLCADHDSCYSASYNKASQTCLRSSSYLVTYGRSVEDPAWASYIDKHYIKSCADLYSINANLARGEHTVYNDANEAILVFCDFKHGFGYTYISPSNTEHVDIDNLYTDTNHVIIRHLRTLDRQYEVMIEQMSDFQDSPLSMQYSTEVGYQAPLNEALKPYVYLGFIPASRFVLHQTQGYRVNGTDYTFTLCGMNRNSYFVFLFNHDNVDAHVYDKGGLSDLVKMWKIDSTELSSEQFLPVSYYAYFELHFGGCGGYGDASKFPNVLGAALGMRYDILCPTPVAIENGSHSYSGTGAVGDFVTYSCDVGYVQQSGNLVRECTETGRWSDQVPVCG